LSELVYVPEKVAERKVIVYKAHINQKVVRIIAEKIKTKMFQKFIFIKPKPREVQIVSIEKYFEPYIVIDGEYSLEYSKDWTHNIQVHDTMQELSIFDGKIEPTSLKDHLKTPCKIVKLKGEGRYKINEKAHLIFDSQWNEVGLERLPFLPFEEQPERILNTLEQKFGRNLMEERKEVDLLKSRIVHRPKDIMIVHNELFKVSERALIFKPMYKVTFQNTKTKKILTKVIDAITAKTVSDKKPKVKATKKKKTLKESISAKASLDNVHTLIIKSEKKLESQPTK
jgi:hypothetical protein